MHPILFHLNFPWGGQMTVYTYGVLVATGVLLGLWYARRRAPAAGLEPDRVWNAGIYFVLAGLLTAKLWLVAIHADEYWRNPSELFSASTLQAGGTFYGGMLGGIAVLVLYCHYQKVAILALLDTFAAAMPLGHAIGRLGCFFAGCCFGKPTSLPWGVTFRNPFANQLSDTPLGIPLHPTQLYESAAELVNFALLIWLDRKQKFTGQILGAYLMLYGVERGLFEFLRGDGDRTLMFHDTVSLMQFVSVGMLFTGAFLWYRGFKQPEPVAASR
ncbi:MAG: prolipoprotein diacylglyceryl transferase [Candidatus Acidiferrales bacterium]